MEPAANDPYLIPESNVQYLHPEEYREAKALQVFKFSRGMEAWKEKERVM